MPHSSKNLVLGLAALAATPLGFAAAHVAPIFTDHMVLQRDARVPVWGSANPGEKVTVAFAGKQQTASTDANGHWSVTLAPLHSSETPLTMTISDGSAERTTLSDVLVGEVWVAGGQSNMRYPLFAVDHAEEVIAAAQDPELRLFHEAFKTAVSPQGDLSGHWEPTTPAAARNFSAVAYFYARELRRTLHCPVGVISASWGGTPIETWISLQGLQKDPPLTHTLQSWQRALAEYQKLQADPKPEQEYVAALARWQKEVQPKYDAAMKAYFKASDAGEKVARPQPEWPEPTNPNPMGMPSPSRRPQTPTVDFNGMIAPLVPYAIRGVIWYQGEANGGAGIEYRSLFPRLIEDWRTHWGCQFPFLFVQLPCFGPDPTPVAEKGWPWLREAQAMALREPKTAMAVTIDIGNPANVHPTDKVDVGHRLALLARRDVYGEKLVASGPMLRDFTVEGDKVRLTFTDAGGRLVIGQAPWRAPRVEPLPTDRLIGFFVAGEDRQWSEAQAVIQGDTVVVSSPAVREPRAVRYGWANSPRCNLYNREGLPAAPFRTDNWAK